MRDWAESSTRWFLLPESEGLIVTPQSRLGLLEAVEQLGRQAGMCMTRQADGTMCYEATPCEKAHG